MRCSVCKKEIKHCDNKVYCRNEFTDGRYVLHCNGKHFCSSFCMKIKYEAKAGMAEEEPKPEA